MEVKLECHLVIESDLKRAWEIISSPSLTLCDCVKKFKDCDTDTFKGISNDHGRLHPQLARTGAVLPHHPVGCNEN